MKFYTNNFQPPKCSALEVVTGISLTEPDQAMSVREIIEKHMRGMPLRVERVMIDDDELNESPLPIHNPDFDLADAYQASISDKHKAVMSAFNDSFRAHASNEKVS